MPIQTVLIKYKEHDLDVVFISELYLGELDTSI